MHARMTRISCALFHVPWQPSGRTRHCGALLAVLTGPATSCTWASFSSARQALTAAPLAPGDTAALAELRDPARQPAAAYSALPCEVLFFQPAEPAGGEKPLLRPHESAWLMLGFGRSLARPQVLCALGLDRLVALQKLSGRVRGVVVSDFFRPLVARSLAQQHAPVFLEACRPHQFALSTRAGADLLVHALASAELDPEATVLFVDGVGAFETVSRRAMLEALRAFSGLTAISRSSVPGLVA